MCKGCEEWENRQLIRSLSSSSKGFLGGGGIWLLLSSSLHCCLFLIVQQRNNFSINSVCTAVNTIFPGEHMKIFPCPSNAIPMYIISSDLGLILSLYTTCGI